MIEAKVKAYTRAYVFSVRQDRSLIRSLIFLSFLGCPRGLVKPNRQKRKGKIPPFSD